MSDTQSYIAVVGASGAVGQEVIKILQERNYPCDKLRLFGSERSAGTEIEYMDCKIVIEHIRTITDSHHDYALLCANADVARTVRKLLEPFDTVIIDNSSAFRMDPDVPLVIPEVNGHLLSDQKLSGQSLSDQNKVIANPNCSTIMLLSAINPLREAFGIRRLSVTTYQAVSGAGLAGINELHAQTRAYLNMEIIPTDVFPSSCAFNVFEHESEIDTATGFNGEETKMIDESRRILEDPHFSMLPTCVRVPVERAHSQSILVEFKTSTSVEFIRESLKREGIRLSPPDQPLTPRDAANLDCVCIGRIRMDPESNGNRAIIWICCDQLRKGAALNAIQIMDMLAQSHICGASADLVRV